MIIYGLFDYTYDYYTFETFLKASKRIDKLEKLCTETIQIVYTEDAHRELAASEMWHYYIKQLEVV